MNGSVTPGQAGFARDTFAAPPGLMFSALPGAGAACRSEGPGAGVGGRVRERGARVNPPSEGETSGAAFALLSLACTAPRERLSALASSLCVVTGLHVRLKCQAV